LFRQEGFYREIIVRKTNIKNILYYFLKIKKYLIFLLGSFIMSLCTITFHINISMLLNPPAIGIKCYAIMDGKYAISRLTKGIKIKK